MPAPSRRSRTFSGRTTTSTGPLGAAPDDRDRAERRDRALAVALTAQQVGVADERRDESARGPRVELGRRPDLQQSARFHHRDAVGEAERLLLVVGDEHRGGVRRAQDVAHFVAHPAAQRRVEVRERLVEQQDRGIGCERPRDRDPLLLATRELVRAAAPLVAEADELEHLADPRRRVRPGRCTP